MQYEFVQRGNMMVSRSLDCTMRDCAFTIGPLRMVLGILLILSRSSYFLVEQPAQSLLYMHKRWQLLANRVAWDSRLKLGALKLPIGGNWCSHPDRFSR